MAPSPRTSCASARSIIQQHSPPSCASVRVEPPTAARNGLSHPHIRRRACNVLYLSHPHRGFPPAPTSSVVITAPIEHRTITLQVSFAPEHLASPSTFPIPISHVQRRTGDLRWPRTPYLCHCMHRRTWRARRRPRAAARSTSPSSRSKTETTVSTAQGYKRRTSHSPCPMTDREVLVSLEGPKRPSAASIRQRAGGFDNAVRTRTTHPAPCAAHFTCGA